MSKPPCFAARFLEVDVATNPVTVAGLPVGAVVMVAVGELPPAPPSMAQTRVAAAPYGEK
jgi:hypothetical protein